MKIRKEKAIIKAKKWIVKMTMEDPDETLMFAKLYNKNASLLVADFKCQKPGCGKEEELTFHHLIMRKAKQFMDIGRYRSQRNYWANIIVLYKKHHQQYHKFFGDDTDENMETITSEKIFKIKEGILK